MKRTHSALSNFLIVIMMCMGCGDTTLQLTDGYLSDDELDALSASEGDRFETPGGVTPGTEVSSGSASIGIMKPSPGELIKEGTFTVEGVAEGLSEVLVQGVVVPVEDGVFEADVTAPGEGAFTVLVTGGDLPNAEVPVVVDLLPPEVVIDHPARGQFLVSTESTKLVVRGRVTDAGSGVTSLKINDVPASVGVDGAFSVELPPKHGLNTVTVVADDGAERSTETFRSAIYGEFSPWGQPAYDAISGRMKPSALDLIEAALSSGMLTNGLLDNLVEGNAPSGGQDFSVDYVRFGRLELDLVPQNGYFDTTVRIYDLRIGVSVTQTVLFFPVTIDGEIQSDPVELNVKLFVNLNEQGGIDAEIRDGTVALHDFDIDIGGLLELFAEIFEGLIREFAEDLLMDVLDVVVLENVLDASALNQTIDLFGKEATLALMLTELGIQPSGVTFALDSDIVLQPDPSIPPSPGILTSPGAAPDDPNQTQDLRITLANNFINTLLFQIWRGGALKLNVTDLLANNEEEGDGGGGGLGLELNAETFALLAGRELLQFASPDTPVGIQIESLLPPVSKLQSPDEGILNIGVGDMLMNFTLEGDGQAPVVWATLAVNLDIDVIIGMTDEGALDFQINIDPQTELISEPLFDVDNNSIELVVEGLLTSLPGLLAEGGEGGGLGGLLGGSDGGESLLDNIMFTEIDVRPDGAGKNFLSIFLNLGVEGM